MSCRMTASVLLATMVVAPTALAAPQPADCTFGCPTPLPETPPVSCCFEGPVGTCQDLSSLPTVCDADPWCCEHGWDDLCIAQYEQAEGEDCPLTLTGRIAPDGTWASMSELGDVGCDGLVADFKQITMETDFPTMYAYGTVDDVELALDDYYGMWGAGGVDGTLIVTDVQDDVVRGFIRTHLTSPLEGGEEGVAFELKIPCGTGSCHEPHDGPGCSDTELEACVCSFDAYCCSVAWDSYCVAETAACD